MKLAKSDLNNYQVSNITSIASTVVNNATTNIPEQTRKTTAATSSLMFSAKTRPSI